MTLDNFYDLEYTDYSLYLHCYMLVLADVSFGLLQVSHVELGSLHRTFKPNPSFNPLG